MIVTRSRQHAESHLRSIAEQIVWKCVICINTCQCSAASHAYINIHNLPLHNLWRCYIVYSYHCTFKSSLWMAKLHWLLEWQRIITSTSYFKFAAWEISAKRSVQYRYWPEIDKDFDWCRSRSDFSSITDWTSNCQSKLSEIILYRPHMTYRLIFQCPTEDCWESRKEMCHYLLQSSESEKLAADSWRSIQSVLTHLYRICEIMRLAIILDLYSLHTRYSHQLHWNIWSWFYCWLFTLFN